MKSNLNPNVDYSRLQKLLSEGKWQEADYETYLVMLAVIDRKEGDWVRPDEMRNFPDRDLGTIDALWQEHSHCKFGFSIQRQIYCDICNSFNIESEFSKEHEELFSNESIEFMRRVGWQVNSYNDLIFQLNQSPKGHLPACWGFRFFGFGWYLLSHTSI